mmetsp:Transcript_98161/g.174746  ORF Transcript_98161/g.174746 Transcript_98161/m.174746 type:complete len:390 (+) Transcript_98161:29-1198(+)
MMSLSVAWLFACAEISSVVKAARPHAVLEMEPAGDFVETLESVCSLRNSGLLQSTAWLRLPAECKPDGLVRMGADALPNVNGSWKAVCYTDAKAKALGIDIQGFPLDSHESIILAAALKARGGTVPQCEAREAAEEGASEGEIGMKSETTTKAQLDAEAPKVQAAEEGDLVDDQAQRDAEDAPDPEEAPDTKEEVAAAVSPLTEANQSAVAATTTGVEDVTPEIKKKKIRPSKPENDSEELPPSPESEFYREAEGESEEAEAADPMDMWKWAASDANIDASGLPNPTVDQEEDKCVSFGEVVNYEHQVYVEKTLKTHFLHQTTISLKDAVRVDMFAFSFTYQTHVHERMASFDRDADGKLCSVEFRDFEKTSEVHENEELEVVSTPLDK